MKRFRIAIFHPNFIAGAGSEVSVAWMAEALKSDYEVSIITMDCADFESLNRAYFSNLNANEIRLIKIPLPNWLRSRFDALRVSLLARFCREKAPEFDLMISAYNVMDFGKKGIQYIVDFSFDDKLRRDLDKGLKGLRRISYIDSPFRLAYLKACEKISGASKKGWLDNITIANSSWTAMKMQEAFCMHPQVVYHPVPGQYPEVKWEEKENGFVCMGRLVPEKGIERVIEIIEKLRQRSLDLHLHILGRADDLGYARRLRRICEKNNSWLFMEGLVLGEDKMRIISGHKFGISGRQNEPFGIAVAEMVKAGSIVWVPDGGGQKEIVNHPDLIYSDIDDAVGKIEHILRDRELQVTLGQHLKEQSEKFSADKFKQEIRELVSQFFSDYEAN